MLPLLSQTFPSCLIIWHEAFSTMWIRSNLWLIIIRVGYYHFYQWYGKVAHWFVKYKRGWNWISTVVQINPQYTQFRTVFIVRDINLFEWHFIRIHSWQLEVIGIFTSFPMCFWWDLQIILHRLYNTWQHANTTWRLPCFQDIV